MIRRALVVMCLVVPMLTAGLASMSSNTPRNNPMRPKSMPDPNITDVSAPLYDMFFTTTTMGIAPGLDTNGNPIYTVTVPVPYYDLANVVWQLSFDQVEFETLSEG